MAVGVDQVWLGRGRDIRLVLAPRREDVRERADGGGEN